MTQNLSHQLLSALLCFTVVMAQTDLGLRVTHYLYGYVSDHPMLDRVIFAEK